MTRAPRIEFRDVLARRRDAGLATRLWLRDDDAVAPGDALDRLLDLTALHSVPVAIATIPAFAEPALAARLREAPHATAVVHGFRHANHAPPHAKKQELGGHRPLPEVLADLSAAMARMQDLFGAGFLPMLVPPWNRIDAALLPRLPRLGYCALSGFGPEPDTAPLPVVNTHVDLIDWRGHRGGRDHAALIDDLLNSLRRAPAARPAGILSHHLVHDETAWAFLERLFAATAEAPECRWLTAAEAIACVSPPVRGA